MRETGLQVGIGRVNITPPLSAPHAGWGAQTHNYPDGVEADLWGTVLVLADQSKLVVLVELDLVIISREESDTIRNEIASLLDVPAENIRVGVSHNHAGPPPSSWNWMPEGRTALQSYYQILPALVSGAALQAYKNLQPARLGIIRGESRVAVNRREKAPNGQTVTGVNPDGAIDPDLLVARLDGFDGSPIATIVGYTMHPTVMGPTNHLISPDWPGHLKRTVESVTGATCLFVQGATGDIGPGPEGFTDDVSVARRIGANVGVEAARLYLSMHVPPREFRHERVWDSGAPLGKWTSTEVDQPEPVLDAASTWIELPVAPQRPLDEARDAAREAEERLTQLVNEYATQDKIEDATYAVKRANMTLTRSEIFGGRDTFPIEVHAVRLGSLVIAGCEGEPFSEIARRIKTESPFEHTWFGGYTGGWLGYIPTPAEFPDGGYEVETSPYTKDAAERLVQGTTAFLTEFANRGMPSSANVKG